MLQIQRNTSAIVGDLAEKHGIGCAVHFAGTPVACMAGVHAIAAMYNFLAMETHSVDVPWWGDLVEGVSKPIVDHGFITIRVESRRPARQ